MPESKQIGKTGRIDICKFFLSFTVMLQGKIKNTLNTLGWASSKLAASSK